MRYFAPFFYCLLLWPAGLLLLALPVPASADSSSLPLLQILVPGDQRSELQSIIDAVESQLIDTQVELASEPLESLPSSLESQIKTAHGVAQRYNCLAVLWCELSAPAKIYLYYPGAQQGRILVREIREPDPWSRAEAISIIVRASVVQLLAGQSIGVNAASALEESRQTSIASSEAAPPRLPQEPPATRPASLAPSEDAPGSAQWEAELAYLLQVHSRQFAVLSGLSLGLSVTLAGHWRLSGQYLMVQPIKQPGQTAILELNRHPMAAGLGYVWSKGRVELGLATALFVDIATFTNSDIQAGYRSETDSRDVIFSLTPSVRLSYKLVERLSLLLSVGAEIPINRKEYTAIIRTEETMNILSVKTIVPWPVQPLFQIGVAIDVLN